MFMIIEKIFKIPATVDIERNAENKITGKNTRPDIDWEVDPILTLHQAEYLYDENGTLWAYVRIMIDEKDLSYYTSKTNWTELQQMPDLT